MRFTIFALVKERIDGVNDTKCYIVVVPEGGRGKRKGSRPLTVARGELLRVPAQTEPEWRRADLSP